MYVSLYRKYRPQSFSDMVGQSAAVGVLRQSLADGRLGHAYLFSGPRGCGKTSAARLVAKALNCSGASEAGESCGACPNCESIAMGEHLDVIEIDGASNRGIGEIRDLKSHVNLKPLSSKYKVYIIDEVHMLTEAAFNALLKTLEEPPANVIFMLATTEPHKVPVTIRSRCQHIPFHRISIGDMVSRINYVAEREGISADGEAVWEIARQADGALRDALSLLEQAVTLGRGSLTLESVNDLMGGSNRTELEKWVRNIRTDPDKAAADLAKMLARGISVERLTESLFGVFRDIWIYRLWGEKSAAAIENSESELAFLKEESANWDVGKSRQICLFLGRLLPRTRYGMRAEVYSGLIMLEILGIIEGRQPQPEVRAQAASAAAPPRQQPARANAVTQPKPQPRMQAPPANEQEYPVWDDDFSDLAEEFAQEPKPAPAARTEVRAKPAKAGIDFMESFGGNDFAKLLTAIGSKALVFGAALLSATIAEEDGKVKLEFGETLTPAESFLSAPQNRKTLLDAVYRIWGAGTPPKTGSKAEQPLFGGVPPEVKKTAVKAAAAEKDAPRPPAKAAKEERGADQEMMLKLMGAELLYASGQRDEASMEERQE